MTIVDIQGRDMSEHIYKAYLCALSADVDSPLVDILSSQKDEPLLSSCESCVMLEELLRLYKRALVLKMAKFGLRNNSIIGKSLLVKTDSVWRVYKKREDQDNDSLVIAGVGGFKPETYYIMYEHQEIEGLSVFRVTEKQSGEESHLVLLARNRRQ